MNRNTHRAGERWAGVLDAIAAMQADEDDSGAPEVVRKLKLGGVDEWGPGYVTKRWRTVEWARNPDGTLFGGYIAALFDQMTSLAGLTVLEDGESTRTARLDVDFLRPVTGVYADIDARVVNKSRSMVHVDATMATGEGKLAARARAVLALARND
ncbi:MAG: PaaI family thioesterase [Maricaulaceae bacterium]|nr:PaaI family thioesterase [Maricaulaceae bacterium]